MKARAGAERLAQAHWTIIAWPDCRVTPALLWWLEDWGGLRRGEGEIRRGMKGDIAGAYNAAVEAALASGAQWLWFADGDAWPRPEFMEPFVLAHGDIVAAGRRGKPGWHATMWRATRRALLKVGAPWFRPPSLIAPGPGGKRMCLCGDFAHRAMKAGLRVTVAGLVGHLPPGTAPERFDLGMMRTPRKARAAQTGSAGR